MSTRSTTALSTSPAASTCPAKVSGAMGKTSRTRLTNQNVHCDQSPATEAPNAGRLLAKFLGAIVSEALGDIVGIASPRATAR
jgi:hypothetical protein